MNIRSFGFASGVYQNDPPLLGISLLKWKRGVIVGEVEMVIGPSDSTAAPAGESFLLSFFSFSCENLTQFLSSIRTVGGVLSCCGSILGFGRKQGLLGCSSGQRGYGLMIIVSTSIVVGGRDCSSDEWCIGGEGR